MEEANKLDEVTDETIVHTEQPTETVASDEVTDETIVSTEQPTETVASDEVVDETIVRTEEPTEVVGTEVVDETIVSTEQPTEVVGTEVVDETVIYPEEPPEVTGALFSTVIDYTLRFTGAPSLAQLVAVAVASAVYIVLSWLAIIALPSGFPVVSAIFLAIGFGVPFAIWFGGWGFVIAYLGNFIGAGLLSNPPLPPNIALWFGTTDLIQLGLPMLLYRLLAKRFGVSPIGKDVFTVRGFVFFVLCAVLPNNIIGGLYGNFVLVQTGILPSNAFLSAWFVWSLSNVVVTLIIGSILLKYLGPVVERFGLTVRNFLS